MHTVENVTEDLVFPTNSRVEKIDERFCDVQSEQDPKNSSLEVSLSINIPGRSTRDDAEMFVGPASGKKAWIVDHIVCTVKPCSRNSYATLKTNTKTSKR